MSYCLIPTCLHPLNPSDQKFCQSCGAMLLLGDRYRALKPIGSGGFGRTFLAIDEYIPSHPHCVIKQLFVHAPGTRKAERAAELFQREAMRLDQLGKHTQIPNLLAHFTQQQYQYLILSYIDGLNLAQELAQQGAFNEAQIRHLLSDLLPVLQFIHDHRVIHRDIKPENVIRQRSTGQLVLVDFGASKFTTQSNLSKTGTIIGSAGYAAPEQVGGKATFASDLYSLGVTCIHLLTEMLPFDLYSFVEGTWVWRNYLQQPVSEELAEILDRMIEPAINRRYATAVDVLQDLEPDRSQVVPLPGALSVSSGDEVKAVTPILSGWLCIRTIASHSQSVSAIALHPNGRLMASAGFDKMIHLWHLNSGSQLASLEGHTQPVVSLVFSPDGEHLISGSVDDTIKIWKSRDGTLVRTITDQADSTVALSVAVSPDGQAIISGSDNHTIKIWHVQTGKLLRTLVDSRAITNIALSPNGSILASASGDNTVKLWNIYTGDRLHTLTGHTRDVNGVVFSADGQLLASGSSDNTLRLWNFQTRKVLTLHGHLDWVNAVAFSPDGQLLASGSSDHTIKLWSLPEGRLLYTLTGHTKRVNALAFTPNGQTLVSASSDRTIKVWRR